MDHPPFQSHSSTSIASAFQIAFAVKRLRERVFVAIQGAGDFGLTDEELTVGLTMNPSTSRPRRRELELAGLIADSGVRRHTASGAEAVVWRAVPGAMYSDGLFKKVDAPLGGDAKAIQEIKDAIPADKRSPELNVLLRRLMKEATPVEAQPADEDILDMRDVLGDLFRR